MSIALSADTLRRCLHFAGLPGAIVRGPWSEGRVPGIGFIRAEMAPYDKRRRRVWVTGLTDERYYTKKSNPDRCVRGTGDHRSIWRFAQVIAEAIITLQKELQRMTTPPHVNMTPDEIRAAIDERRAGLAAGPRSFNQLADAIGVNRSTMRAALSVGPLSNELAMKCTAYLRGFAERAG